MAVTNADILGWLNANPGADAALINQTMAEAGVSAAQYQSATGTPPPPVEPASVVDLYQQVLGRPPESQAVVDEWTRQFGSTIDPTEVAQFEQAAQLEKTNPAAANIKGQILSQGTTDKWTGEGKGSAEANAADMANILAGIGITDITQFGQLPDGSFGNKLTGQPVPNTYSERQTGNAFGGTFAGKGNTGYRVEFDPSGKPLFYTTGASSSDVPSWVKPALILGGAYFGLNAAGLLGGAGAAGAAGLTAAEAAGLGLTASEAAALGLSASEFAAAGGLGAGFTAAGLPSGVGTFLGENVVSGIPAWDAAFTGAGGLFNSAFGLPAGNGAFLGEGVPSGVPAWDTAYTTAGGVFDPAFALGPDGLVGNPLPPITPPVIPPVIPPTSTPSTNFLNNLTPGQIANIVGGVGGLIGGAGIASAITGGGGTGGGVGALPTQGVPLNTADYYNAIQQNYNRLLPAVPRDVATPLAQWYNSTYGA